MAAGSFPERKYITPEARPPSLLASVAFLAGGSLLAGAVFRLTSSRR
ncbi:MAG: hypothetical protein ACR2NX_09715 [Chthoniobacterales bacterium]